jgi:trimeric autotransporter adhesin
MSRRARFLILSMAVCTLLLHGDAYAATQLRSLTISPSAVTGGTNPTGTVTVTEAPAMGTSFSVQLTSSIASAQVSSTVVFLGGMTSKTFEIRTSGVNSARTAEIQASAGGIEKTASITINPPTLTAMSLIASQVVGGTPLSGTVTISGPAPSGGFAVPVVSTSPSTISLPAVSVPSGLTSVSFVVDCTPVSTAVSATITAGQGAGSRTASLTVIPPEVESVSLVVNNGSATTGFPGGISSNSTLRIVLTGPLPSDLTFTLTGSPEVLDPFSHELPATFTREGSLSSPRRNVEVILQTKPVAVDTNVSVKVRAGSVEKGLKFLLIPPTPDQVLFGGRGETSAVIGGAVVSNCQVRLNAPAPAEGLSIPFSSNVNDAVPQSVKFKSGLDSQVFAVTTTPVATTTLLNFSSGSKVLRGRLSVLPPAVSSLVFLTPTRGGATVRASVVLSGEAPAGGFSIALASSNTFAATVPATMTIAAGATTGSFDISTNPVQTDTPVNITSSAAGTTKALLLVVQTGT